MIWFWCQLYNNTQAPVRVVIISAYGQGTYFINPGQYQWIQWYPGVKVLVAWDQFSQQLLTTYAFNITGPVVQTVVQGNIQFVPGQPYSATPPGPGGQPGPTH